MMPLEKQVPKRELCERMKELGFEQNTEFAWWQRLIDMANGPARLIRRGQITSRDGATVASAPSVAELGMALPADTESSRYKDGSWHCLGAFGMKTGNSEADARAKMWIHLRESGLI